jgi:phosphoribosylamine--glycine ligase
MKVLFVEPHADGLLDIAMRARANGHQALYFMKEYDQHKAPVGRGLVERVPDWRSAARDVDLVVLGAGDYCMNEFTALHRSGKPVVGGTVESARWEGDRIHGMSIFKKAGIPIPPVREFTDYAAAIEYVRQQDRPFASKPCWDGADKSLSYVGKTPEDLIYMLDRWRRKWGRPKGPFVLQEKVEGVEVGVAAWFGKDGFAGGWEENFEEKKLCAGSLGPATGEMGTTIRYVSSSRLADKLLKPLEEMLHRLDYIGNVSVNSIVDDDGTPWPLEFTMRCGWPSTNIEMELFATDPIEFWHDLATGRVSRGHHHLNLPAVGVVLAIPDFPYSHMTSKETVGIPMYGAEKLMAHLHPAQMMWQNVDARSVTSAGLATAGDYVAIMTGTGETVRQASGAAYRRLKQIELPSSPFWRIDIGERLRKDLPRLQEHGYALGMEF